MGVWGGKERRREVRPLSGAAGEVTEVMLGRRLGVVGVGLWWLRFELHNLVHAPPIEAAGWGSSARRACRTKVPTSKSMGGPP